MTTPFTSTLDDLNTHTEVVDAEETQETKLSMKKKPSGEPVRAYGAIIVQRGTPIFLGPLRAEEVVRQKRVDIYDPETTSGYQREPNHTRINEAGRYYNSGG